MIHTSYQGIPGMLRPFKEYLEQKALPSGAEVVFCGVPGTCTPFVELLCYAARSLSCTFIFVPFLDETKSRKMVFTDGIGYQPGELCPVTNPSVIIMMGGLAMPGMTVTLDQVEALFNAHPDCAKVGICFMNMFEKAGWLERFSFDILINAIITVDVLTI
ncbi:MAG: DUF2124 domain-containing protein [Methanospirillum sp.]|uniref:DUF2124 family protein n=1 Tax=Methanospirillum sp. TaxID=45200 RepID=UPI002374E8C2|nr:DUF2124 family protein [Methanospirillum sp.]MDD1729129.1 DUF2124 domain-containing protein [Methanospirillum sp.]